MCTTCGCAEGNLYIEGDEHNPHSAFRSAPFAPAARPALNIVAISQIRIIFIYPYLVLYNIAKAIFDD